MILKTKGLQSMLKTDLFLILGWPFIVLYVPEVICIYSLCVEEIAYDDALLGQ